MSTKTRKTATAKTKTVATKPTAKTVTPKAKTAVNKTAVKSVTPKSTPKVTAAKNSNNKNKVSNRNTIAVVQLTPRGRRIKKYNSIADAQRATGVNTGSISKAVRGICKTAGGYVWTNC
jgi:hypothetical protein